MTVLVKKLGGSMAVVIPKAMARQMELTEGTSLDITATAEGVMLRKQGRRPRRPLSTFVGLIDPKSYRERTRELAEEQLVGKEIG
jgi:antitoxin component of MazEF toxin-antitoxin module